MRKIVLILSLLPLFVLGQNLLDQRSSRNPNATSPAIESQVVDGRNSNGTSFWTPATFPENAGNSTPQKINYWLRYDADKGLPNYLEVLQPEQPEPRGGIVVSQEREVLGINEVFAALPGLFAWSEKTTLTKTKQYKDKLGYEHYRYQQYQNGVEVRGGEWSLQLKNGAVLKGRGRIYPSATIDVANTITEEAAIEKAQTYIYNQVKAYVAPQENCPFDRHSHAHLQLDFEIGEGLNAQLVYVVEVRPTNLYHYHVWVDANTGKVLKVQDELCSVDGPRTATNQDLNNQNRTLNTYQVGSSYVLIDGTKSMWTNSQPSGFPSNPVGAVWTLTASNTAATSVSQVVSNSNSWSDRSSVSAHANAGLAFDYFKATHNRNSINGSGGTIISVVNVSDDDGSALDNAYWNGQAMFYGNGASAFKPLAGALDVAGHELSHGVVSNTANLEYQGQSGAINESMADVFGAMIDRDDWKMGENIVKPGVFPGGALRDLRNPHNGGNSLNDRGYQPEKMSEYYTGTQDNGGVHINSGIVNRAYYLTANVITKEKAEKIWYRALVQYLTSRSQFLDLRYACVDAAKDLYGATEVAAVKSAFDTVQIFDPKGDTTGGGGGGTGGGGTGGDLPTNPGAESIVSYDIDVNNSNTWYKSTTVGSNYEELTTTVPKRPCSITDDGSDMFYIDVNSRLRRIDLSNTSYTETTLGTDLWNNVAISKDGKRLAAISATQDNKIYVYDFEGQSWNTFTLYNPTYTEGVDAGNVNYADALEWDNTGQYVLYDAQNEITNNGGNNIQYWDVGLIRVWDNGANAFGDGKVDKLFTQLPDGISIGNGSFSKNSPYIIVFDVISSTGVEVSATNTLTNITNVIFAQEQLGYPNYSNKDDKLIFDAVDDLDNPVIAVIGLNTDKISPVSSDPGAVVIPDAKWGKWYAKGTRSLLSGEKDILSFSFPSVSSGAIATISGSTISVELPFGSSVVDLVPTFTHSLAAEVFVGGDVQVSGVNKQTFSTNKIYTVKAQDGSAKNYTVKVTVSTVTSVADINKQVTLFPNPTTSEVYIAGAAQVQNVSCYDVSGRQINIATDGNMVQLAALPAGLYFLYIETSNGTAIKRISKQ